MDYRASLWPDYGLVLDYHDAGGDLLARVYVAPHQVGADEATIFFPATCEWVEIEGQNKDCDCYRAAGLLINYRFGENPARSFTPRAASAPRVDLSALPTPSRAADILDGLHTPSTCRTTALLDAL